MRRLLHLLLAPILAALLLGSGLTPATAAPTAAEQQSQGAELPRLRVITYNMNQFRTDGPAGRIADLQRLLDQADVLLIQEARGFDVASLVRGTDNPGRFVVKQAADRASEKAGGVIVVRRELLGQQGVTDFGFRFGVRAASTAECNNHQDGGHGARWIAKARLHLSNGAKVWVASAHVPPKRCHAATLEPMMDSIKFFLNQHSSQRAIVGADWNLALSSNPRGVCGGSTGYTYQAPDTSIDGFVLTDSLKVSRQAYRLSKRPPGDHHPIRMNVLLHG